MFIEIGGTYYNTEYIKCISNNMVIIANTEAVAFAMAGSPYSSGETRSKSDHAICITNEQYLSIIEQMEQKNIVDKLKDENAELKRCIDTMKLELQYRPGGPGYQHAKAEFETLIE